MSFLADNTMAFNQYFAREWGSAPGETLESRSHSNNSCFDCNICLDFARDPVVTLCGHLYCWPCIYKWLHIQSASLAQDEHPLCPVCKAQISHTAMVPLYGRGQGSSPEELEWKLTDDHVAIPPRPACGQLQALTLAAESRGSQQLPYRNPYQNMGTNSALFGNYRDENAPSPPLISLTSPGIHNPTIGALGEMVYARTFGNSGSLHGYPQPYHPIGSLVPRMRRQDMQAHNSLNRVSVFLFCCFLLCLIVF